MRTQPTRRKGQGPSPSPLAALGLSRDELQLAQLVPAVEMAWADGVVGPDELAALEGLCEVARGQLAAARAHRAVRQLVAHRLAPPQLDEVLAALRASFPSLEERRQMVDWAEAIASVDDEQWDPRERAWSERLRSALGVE